MKKIILCSFMVTSLFGTITVNAQEKVKFTKEQRKVMDDNLFQENFTGFSSKKTSTVILKDGKTIKGAATDLDRKKGQIYSIEIKDASNKRKVYNAEDIAEMYLPISVSAKISKINGYFGNAKNWGRRSLNKTTNPNEIYVRNVKASLKNKKEEQEFLMQLINPDFNHIIEVYADPTAGQTMSVSFGGGPAVGGGLIKSYYIKKGEEVIWLKKSEFEDHYQFMFGDNEEFMKKFPHKAIEWEQLSYLIAEYTNLSSK